MKKFSEFEKRSESRQWTFFISSGTPDFSTIGLESYPVAPDCSRRDVWEAMYKAWETTEPVCSAEEFYTENETNIIGKIREGE